MKKKAGDEPMAEGIGGEAVAADGAGEEASSEAVADDGGEAVRAQAEAEAPPDDRFLRLQADFENFRKRTLRERESLYQRANSDLIAELLPVLDHLELALQAAPCAAEARSFVDGVRLVFDQALSVLGKFGLTPIETEGKAFDPTEHEAISHLPSPDKEENQVMAETRRGYRLGDRVLRAAQVVVSSGREEKDEATFGSETSGAAGAR